MQNHKLILFEPWNLGDAVIAFATALQDPERIALACSSRWHSILRHAACGMDVPTLIPADLGYVTRHKHKASMKALPMELTRGATVLSIRGDVRDYRAAKALFPDSTIKMTGWISFLAKRSALIDYGFAKGWLGVRNRYEAWARLAGVDWSKIQDFYAQHRTSSIPSVVIHVGAQWRSKQFPDAAHLLQSLRRICNVKAIAGPGDPLPEGIRESDVSRLVDGGLVTAFAASTHVVANDSGPMHIAALLRCRTFVVTNRAAMREWMAPAAVSIEAQASFRGYHAPRLSDAILPEWPETEAIVNQLDLKGFVPSRDVHSVAVS